MNGTWGSPLFLGVIQEEKNKQIFLTATCLSLIIRFLILLVIERAQNLITFSSRGREATLLL